MQYTGIAPAARWAGALIALVLTVAPAPPAAADPGPVSASARLLIPEAGWHGRPIRNPHHHAVPTASAERRLPGWEAGPVALGTGTHRPSGSQRVREVQRRLGALGYRPGPVDGIFGVRTRAAVAWFQVKHGLRVDGRATLAVVAHLRARTSSGRTGAQERRVGIPGDTAADAFRTLVTPTAPAVVQADDDGPPAWWLAGLLPLAFAIGFTGFAVLQHGARRRRALPVYAALPDTGAPRALGYARAGSEQRVQAQATTIAERCAAHGMALTGLITDDADERGGRDRPGLGYALRQLQSDEADCLVVGRIGDLTRSPDELGELLDAMGEREAPLVILNAGPPERRRSRRWSGGDDAADRALGRRRRDV
jgi:peptidoglycan hydrolase-like protein with peptidoglycan-binding domain